MNESETSLSEEEKSNVQRLVDLWGVHDDAYPLSAKAANAVKRKFVVEPELRQGSKDGRPVIEIVDEGRMLIILSTSYFDLIGGSSKFVTTSPAADKTKEALRAKGFDDGMIAEIAALIDDTVEHTAGQVLAILNERPISATSDAESVPN